VTIACWEWGVYLVRRRQQGRARKRSLLAADRTRLADPAREGPQVSTSTSVLAKVEAVKSDYDEAILLDDNGYVCEGTGENIYVVRDGVIATPGQSNSILDGNHAPLDHPDRPRSRLHDRRARHRAREMYLADEVFMSGTAC